MKLVFLFCLFVLAKSAPTPDSDDNSSESNEQSFNETAAEGKVDAAIVASAPAGARAFGSGTSPGITQCNSNCERNWRKEQGLSGHGSDNWNLNTFCTAHDKFKTCLNGCGRSDDKEKWIRRIAKDQWVCHDSTYKQNAACLNEAFKATGNCDSRSKCGKHDSDDGSLKDMVKQLCISMKCKIDCRGPTIVSKCGQAAKNDEAGMAKKTAEYLKWRVVTSAGRSQDYPAECDQVIHA